MNDVAKPGTPENPVVVSMGPTSHKIQGYGWRPDPPDHRDRIFNVEDTILTSERMPTQVDLTASMPPVYDQGQLGSCTGNGIAGVMEYGSMKEGKPADTPSRLFIYYNERVIENTVSQDAGAEIRDGIKTVVNQGVCSETIWPYDISQFAAQPPQAAYDAAVKDEALVYKRVQVGPGAPLRTALVRGYPIVFGFSVPDYFEGSWDPTSQPLPLPGPKTQIIGGHCVVLVGFDYSLSRFSVPVFKARNSWGASWGEAGYFYIPATWFTVSESLAGDMWIIQKVTS